MQSVIFTVSVLIFLSVFFGEGDCAAASDDLAYIPDYVDGINKLIPVEKRRINIFDFLKNSKNLIDLETAAKENIARSKAVLAEVFNLLISGSPGCLYEPKGELNSNIDILKDFSYRTSSLNHSKTRYFEIGEEIEIDTYVGQILDFLVVYKEVDKKDDAFKKLHFTEFPPIGNFAEPLANALIYLFPEEGIQAGDNFYYKLYRAIFDDDEAAVNENKSTDDGNKSTDDGNKSTDDGNKSDGNGDVPASGNLGKYFLIGTCIALPLIIIGVVIIFMLRKK
jgi:hypothetical protein